VHLACAAKPISVGLKLAQWQPSGQPTDERRADTHHLHREREGRLYRVLIFVSHGLWLKREK
jgi:hypothetical protein